MLPELPGAFHVLGRELHHSRRLHPRPQQVSAFRLGHLRQPLLAPGIPRAHAALRQEPQQVATGPRAEPPVQVAARHDHAGRENQPGRFGHVEPSLPGLVAAQAGERLGDLRVGTQMAEGVDGMCPGAERQGAEHVEQPMQLGRVVRLERRQALDRQHRPGRPVAHLLRHFPHELVALVHQVADITDGKRMRRHDRSHEVGRLARHDEAGEPFVHRQQRQRDPQIQEGRLVAAAQVSVERGVDACRRPAGCSWPAIARGSRRGPGWLPGSGRGTPPRRPRPAAASARPARARSPRTARSSPVRASGRGTGSRDAPGPRRSRPDPRRARETASTSSTSLCSVHSSSSDTQTFAKIGHVQVACVGHGQFRGPTGAGPANGR